MVRLAIPPATVGGDLRRRLATAWAESIALRGYSKTTIQHIVELSGISRSTFYGHFSCKDEAFVAIHADAIASFSARLEQAAAREADWPRKVAACLAAALEATASRPREAQLLVGDPFAAGPTLGYCQEQLIARFAPGLAVGRKLSRRLRLPASLEAGLIGSLVSIFSNRVRTGSAHTLPALAPALTEFILAPYLGREEARRVAGA